MFCTETEVTFFPKNGFVISKATALVFTVVSGYIKKWR